MRLFAMACSLVLASSMTAAAQTRAAAAPAKATASDPVRTVEIVGIDDMKYSVTTIQAKPGETLKIRLTTKSSMPKIVMSHNVVVLKLDTDVNAFVTAGAPHRATDFIQPAMNKAIIAKTAMAGGGETVEVTFKVPAAAGNYPYICTFPGHYQSGMKGTLIVK